MIKAKQKIILLFSILLFTLSISLPTQSAELNPNICGNSEVVFGFFNGVKTLKIEVYDAIKEFKKIHSAQFENGDKIEYEVFYNQTAGFEDFVEIFISGERNV